MRRTILQAEVPVTGRSSLFDKVKKGRLVDIILCYSANFELILKMFEYLPIEIILFYSFFKMFLYYQQLHWKDFRGASQIFGNILGLSAILATISGLIFLVYYGFQVVWWAPILLLAIGFLFQFIATFIEFLVGKFTISLLGFIGWPICIYFLFILTPIR